MELNINKIASELEIFGSLEGARDVTIIAPDKIRFYRRILYNYYTEVTCKFTKKETRQGGVYCSFNMSWVDVDNRKFNVKSEKHFTLASLINDVITRQRNIIA